MKLVKKYYPLISMDAEGTEKAPLFPSPSKAVVSRHHHYYLEEDSLCNFRLYTNEPYSFEDYAGYKLHCPYCGKTMQLIAATRDGERLGLYACSCCK